MHLTGDGQGHLAIALAGRRGLEFGDTLFQVCAAVAAKIGRSGRAHAHDKPKSGGDGEATGRFHQCPVHIHLQSYIALMQEAARACPASAPCPGRDARTRVCAGAENRTRIRFDATLTDGELRENAVRLPKRSAGLASCCSAPSTPVRLPTGLHGDERSDLKNGPAARLDDKWSRISRVNR